MCGCVNVINRHHSAGFTLIEMLITVAIVAILASVAMPLTSVVEQRRKETELRQNLREIRTAIDAYKQATLEGKIALELDQSGYPPKLEILVEGVADAMNPAENKKLRFLRSLPRDPMAHDVQAKSEDTWELRCYESSADAPTPGKDVFDVHSKSNEVGLNGIPYNKW